MSLTDKVNEQNATIAVLKASEVELTEGPDAALKVLGLPTDPIRLRAMIALLLRADRAQVAADLLRDQRLDEKWIDLAAVLFASLGQFQQARSIVDHFDNPSNPAQMRLVHLGFAEGVIQYWRKQYPEQSLLEPKDWADSDVELAQTTIEVLDPLLALVRANQRIDGEYELGAVTYAAYCAHVSKDARLLSQCIRWLVTHVPLPLVVAELCFRGMVEHEPDNLPNRLRFEHAGDFQAAFLAALIERELLGRAEDALDALLQLSEVAVSDADKLSVCIALFETCGKCDLTRIERTAQTVKRLRPADTRLQGLVETVKHLVENKLADAQHDLDAIRDDKDGVWWQAYAQLCEKRGDNDAAQEAWGKASELLPHPDVLRRSVKASLDRKKYANAVEGLVKLLQKDPRNTLHLNTVAWTLVQMGKYPDAKAYFERLVDVDPSNIEYRIRFAHCLARLSKVSEAIKVLDPVCHAEDPPLHAMLLQSELLAADNRPGDAFRLLDAIAADHWDNPRFLLIYMRHGHAGGHDELAHKAFGRLVELRHEGKVPPELMQEETLEQLLEYGKEYNAQREMLQHGVVSCRMPWLFVDAILGHPAVWAWELHTQELKWLSEEPLSRAALSIYATNGFVVQTTSAGKTLAEIGAPACGVEVVADLSAILTLYHLGRLEQATDYFRRILLPATYGDLRIREADRFGLHQPSREAELKKLRAAIDRDQIHVFDNAANHLRAVNEYTDEKETPHAYRLQDLIEPLLVSQKASSAVIDDLKRVAYKSSTVDEDHPSLQVGDSILIDLMTLRTLSSQAVFETVLGSFSVFIRASQRAELVSELAAHEKARAVRLIHDALWNAVSSLETRGKIQWQPMPPDTDQNATQDDTPPSVYLDAVQLAQHLNKPVLADDRVLQGIGSQWAPESASHAFGSDCVLKALHDSGACNVTEVANDIHRLMEWRYRFIVPTAEHLVEWASQAMGYLPGPKLLDVAVYLHDCLMDPGLLCGSEQTDPPMPMAAKFVNSWLNSIVTFLRRIWNDGMFSVDKCLSLTRWIGEELLPSCPKGFWYQPIGHRIAHVERKLTFGMALVQLAAVSNPERANLGLRTFAKALGFGEEQYLSAVVDGIYASTDKDDARGEHAEAHLAFSRVMMQNALLHYADKGMDALHFARFRALGLLRDQSPPSMPPDLADVLRSPTHPNRAHIPVGPLVFVLENQTAQVVEVATILLHPDPTLRSAAIAYLQAGTEARDAWLTTGTLELLAKRHDDIQAESEDQWRSAAIEVVTAVRGDLFGHLAGLRQSLTCRYQEGIDKYLECAIHPTFETLVNLRPPLWSPNEQRDEIAAWIAEASALPDFETALSQYLDRWGYVPLCAELGAHNLVKSWIERHPDSHMAWDELWAWACRAPTPLAKYHALVVALHIPAMRPKDSVEAFWKEVVDALDLQEGSSSIWVAFCELASHFVRHIEGLHPGQLGERVACYAWWLADKVGRLVASDDARAKYFEETILTPAAHFSYFRWTVSRSPVVPSAFRHATLDVRSVWAMSLLVQLSLAAKSSPEHVLPEPLRPRVTKVLHGYLLASNLADNFDSTASTFAFEDNARLEALCSTEGYVSEDMRQALWQMVQFRRGLSEPQELQTRLAGLLGLPINEQHVTLLVLRDMLHATAKCDSIIDTWLNQTRDIVDILNHGPVVLVEPLLQILSEFQQRPMTRWPSRLPHVLAYAIEQSDDPGRASLLSWSVLQMSVNGGVASPITRLVCSNKWPDWRTCIATWRENLVEVAKHSEPWIAARIRAVSAMVSRIIGPRTATGRETGKNEAGSESNG